MSDLMCSPFSSGIQQQFHNFTTPDTAANPMMRKGGEAESSLWDGSYFWLSTLHEM